MEEFHCRGPPTTRQRRRSNQKLTRTLDLLPLTSRKWCTTQECFHYSCARNNRDNTKKKQRPNKTDEWILRNVEMILRRGNGTIRMETVALSQCQPTIPHGLQWMGTRGKKLVTKCLITALPRKLIPYGDHVSFETWTAYIYHVSSKYKIRTQNPGKVLLLNSPHQDTISLSLESIIWVYLTL